MKKNLSLLMLAILLSMASLSAQTSGQCGDNVSWNLTGSKLYIYGLGDMWDYWWHDLLGSYPPPWKEFVENITEVVINTGVTNIGSGSFHYCKNLTAVTIEINVKSIGDRAFQACAALSEIHIPPGVTYIGKNAFEGCASLSSFTIPSGVTHIEIGTFAYSGLTSITIPKNVKTIGDRFIYPSPNGPFEYCENLTSINISDGVTLIGLNTFKGCKSLTSIKLPNSLISIWDDFYECDKLASLFIPSSITGAIGFYRDCENLKFIQCNLKIPPTIYSSYFHSSIYSVCVLKVPTSSVSLYQEANVWKDFIIEAGGYLVAPKPDNSEYGFVKGDDLYTGRATATVEAVAFDGYHFVNWTKDGEIVSTANPYSFTVSEDVELIANFDEGAGIVETRLIESAQVYPNPTTGVFKVSGLKFKVESVEIFDVYGHRVLISPFGGARAKVSPFGGGRGEASMNISHLPAGIYFVKITTEAGVFVNKIIKQ